MDPAVGMGTPVGLAVGMGMPVGPAVGMGTPVGPAVGMGTPVGPVVRIGMVAGLAVGMGIGVGLGSRDGNGREPPCIALSFQSPVSVPLASRSLSLARRRVLSALTNPP